VNWPSEKKALDAIEEAYDRLEAERNKGPKADTTRIGVLQAQLQMAIDGAEAFAVPNEYMGIIETNGGAGVNAGTSLDSTEYYYSLPSNRTELWFLMESQRFLRPVFREFYKERDVVLEEHRMRVESSPQGKLTQDLLATAFAAHPYRNPPGGWPSDIVNLRRADAKAFFDKYYVPANITMAIVGDVNPADAKRMAERYFNPLPARPLPPLLHTVEPPQPGPKTAVVDSPTQPIVAIAYKRPDQYAKDDPVFDVMSLILSSGRTGLLYKDLVQEKKIALVAQASASYPDGRYPNLFVFFMAPSVGHTVDEDMKALDNLLAQFKARKVDAETLARVKTKARAGVIRRLDDNTGLAQMLATYYASYGDWRKLFTSIDDLNRVTADDVQRVARQYFVLPSRTVAYLAQPGPVGAPAGAPGGHP
jgi:predicted Zn-dependent peptidase